MTTSLSPATRPVTSRCEVCTAPVAVTRLFTDGPTRRYRTGRFVDYMRPLNRGIVCSGCGSTRGTVTVMERKPLPEPREEIVKEIKRLKRLGYIMFEGDRRWT